MDGMGKDELIDLDQHFTCWKGYLIRTAFEDLLAGVRREQGRLGGRRFLVTQFRQEFDIDGLTEYVVSIEGFDDLMQAQAFADGEADRLSKLCQGGGWRSEDPDTLYKLSHVRKTADNVKRVYYRGFKLSDGSGFNSVYRHFEVLEVSSECVIGDDLFRYLNCQQELIKYFMDVGRGFN